MITHPARALPPGVTPGPVTMPTPDRPRGAASPPAAQPPAPTAPGDTARELLTLLREHGHDHVYATAFGDRAVLSLRTLTIWVTSRGLTWIHQGQATTWHAPDLDGAARHLTRLTQQPTPAARHTRQPAP